VDACTGSPGQRWTLVKGTLVNTASGRCLDDPDYDVTTGTRLEIFACSGGANQQWTLP
jgi:hypothetical protein